MNIDDFVRERKDDWKKLEEISSKLRPAMPPRLSKEELWQLGKLYKGAVSDLALLKGSGLAAEADRALAAYLNGLLIRVHGVIYRKPPFQWASVREFLVAGFPAAVREASVFVLISASLMLLFWVTGFALGLEQPGFIEMLVPERIIQTVERGGVWFNDLFAIAPQASSRLMTHNISVTFFVAAAGITFGLGTVFLLALNGLLLGTVSALCLKHDLSLEFWSFVLPHGSMELTAIVIGGAAGLIIGHALIDPGPYRRSDYLSLRGRLAGQLALGCVPLLVLAGIIEAFFSPSPLPSWIKLAFAAVLFPLLVAFFALSGRKEQEVLHASASGGKAKTWASVPDPSRLRASFRSRRTS